MLSPSRLDRAGIAARCPHKGSMCLLDRVEAWDAQHIECSTGTHRDPANPLRAFGRLGAVCGIEYAAQAMAVHGSVLSSDAADAARAGYLVSVRDTQMHVPRLDDIAADLQVTATCIMRSANTILYGFSVNAAGKVLLIGRATVVIDAGTLSATTGETT